MEPVNMQSVIDAADTVGVIAILLIGCILFIRGDVMSRRVWTDLTKRTVDEMSEKVVSKIIECFEKREKN